MKNVPHPNWVPAPAPEAVGAIAGEAAVVTDADVGGIEAPPAANPWANPIAAFSRPAAARAVDEKHTHMTRADEAIAFLREHGPASPSELLRAMAITSRGGVTPFINGALKDGRIVRVDGKYALPDAPSAAEKSSELDASVAPPASTVAEAAAAIAAMRQPPADTAAAPAAISHFQAATAIVAKRKPKAPRIEAPMPAPAPSPAPTAEPEPVMVTGRKPEFVLFVGDIQLLSWTDGDLTIQTEDSRVDLNQQHFRALMTLVELRK